MTFVKVLLIILVFAFIIFGFYTKRLYKKDKWLDGSDIKSKNQARIETLIALGSFMAAFGVMYLITLF